MNSSLSISYWRDVLLTSLAPAIWGSTYIVATEFLPPDRPFTAALIRVLPAGILLLLLTRRLPAFRETGRLVIISALNIGLFQSLLFVAAERLPGGLAAVLGAVQPLLVMGLNWAIDRRAPAKVTLWAALAGVAGMTVLLISPKTVFDPVGIAAALLGAGSMASGVWLTRRWQINLPVMALTGWQFILGGIMLAPAAWLIDTPLPVLTSSQYAAYTWLSMAGAFIAYGLWFRGITRLPGVAVASLGLLSPLVAVLLGWIILSQAFSGTAFCGLIIVLTSVLIVQRTSASS